MAAGSCAKRSRYRAWRCDFIAQVYEMRGCGGVGRGNEVGSQFGWTTVVAPGEVPRRLPPGNRQRSGDRSRHRPSGPTGSQPRSGGLSIVIGAFYCLPRRGAAARASECGVHLGTRHIPRAVTLPAVTARQGAKRPRDHAPTIDAVQSRVRAVGGDSVRREPRRIGESAGIPVSIDHRDNRRCALFASRAALQAEHDRQGKQHEGLQCGYSASFCCVHHLQSRK